MNTEETLNAVEGRVIFPSELLELTAVQDGNSVISFWLERPMVGKTGEVSFSGITPGGYKGAKRLIFSMRFTIKQEGKGMFNIRDAKALQNDGAGTEANLKTFDLQFTTPKKELLSLVPISEAKDSERPETFAPEIGEARALFDGKWFIVFTARDKGVGVDRYEIKETRQKIFNWSSKWVPAESPYVLRDQALQSFVFVKAIDKDGNERIVNIPPRNPLAWYHHYENWTIIIPWLAIYMIGKLLWRKYPK
ncbi:MAG: hypothetical protein HY980_00175 [Candidatus Magasanikbacteria bacterium]|nr:hypothetical protein [Candidatus Magasanikbacteria bacterium]